MCDKGLILLNAKCLSCLCSKHVLSEDVLERWVKNNKLFTKRIICKTNSIPKWGESLAKGNKYMYVVEESVLDLTTQTFVTYTRNIALQKILVILYVLFFLLDCFLKDCNTHLKKNALSLCDF